MCRNRYSCWCCCTSFHARRTERCGNFHKRIACVKESKVEYVKGECPNCETERRAEERRQLREQRKRTEELAKKRLVSIAEDQEDAEEELDLESIGRAI